MESRSPNGPVLLTKVPRPCSLLNYYNTFILPLFLEILNVKWLPCQCEMLPLNAPLIKMPLVLTRNRSSIKPGR